MTPLDALTIFLFLLLIGIPWIWGLLDMYGMYRFSRSKVIDTTAALLHWWEVKALYTTQAKAMVKLFPWLGMDLSEDRKVTKEDGRVS